MSGSIYAYTFRGKTTGKYYFYTVDALPAALLDASGNILELSTATINGEFLVLCSQAGEMRRGTKGNPGASDPYGFGYNASPWELP